MIELTRYDWNSSEAADSYNILTFPVRVFVYTAYFVGNILERFIWDVPSIKEFCMYPGAIIHHYRNRRITNDTSG